MQNYIVNNKNNFDTYLSMDPHNFDQTKDGRRGIADQGIKEMILSDFDDKNKIIESIELMKFYLKFYKFDTNETRYKDFPDLIEFHIAQIYAQMGDYENALIYFEKLKNKGYQNVGVEYLNFTIAFLRRDKKTMTDIFENIDVNIINYQIIEKMYNNIDLSYLEACDGMAIEDIKKYLQDKG